MKTLRVKIPNREYDILIGDDLLSSVGSLLRERFAPKRIFVVTDHNVNALYGETVCRSLSEAGFSVKSVSLPAGEQTKCAEELMHLYREVLAFSLTRHDMVVALGGGVIGDLAGFMAATLLRGIPFVQIPTTLLAQVDSSVGGKVAIDLDEGKNLVGAFYQPKLVIADPKTLATLSDRIFYDGLAEVIKYGLIADKNLFRMLADAKNRDGLSDKMPEILYTCCDIKRAVVEEDEHDNARRMILNFGHTIGHVIEQQYHYETYTHGQAVACGMQMAAQIGETLGITPQGTKETIEKILTQYSLPFGIPLAKNAGQVLRLDKKNEGENVRMILLSEIGNAVIHSMPLSELEQHLNDFS